MLLTASALWLNKQLNVLWTNMERTLKHMLWNISVQGMKHVGPFTA